MADYKIINWKKIFKVGVIIYFSIMSFTALFSDYSGKKWYYDDVNYFVLDTYSKDKAFEHIEFQRDYKRDFRNNNKIPFDLKKSDLKRENMSIIDHIKEFKVIALLYLLFVILILFIYCVGEYYGYGTYILEKKLQDRHNDS